MAPNLIDDLDNQLASLNQLKPPGASKNKIGNITQLCQENIQAEFDIVQSLYRALKKAPATHKLGALYVIDSVVRRWIEAAKQNNMPLNPQSRTEQGTYSAAVNRVTELMPALFEDIAKGIPSEQRAKLENVINIWDKGGTFPTKMLGEFKTRLGASAPNPAASVNGSGARHHHSSGSAKFTAPIPSRPLLTPTGYPPQHLYNQGYIIRKGEAPQPSMPQQPSVASAPPADVNSILAALANAVPKSAPPQSLPVSHTPSINAQQQLPTGIAALLAQQQTPVSQYSAPVQQPTQYPAPVQAPPPFAMAGFPGFPPAQPASIPQQTPFAPAPPPQQFQAPAAANDPLGPLRGILPPSILADNNKLVMALNLLQDLQKQGLPMEQWGPILQALDQSTAPPHAPAVAANTNSIPDRTQSYNNQYDRRDRSRSPDRGQRNGRGSPTYGAYGSDRRQDYRQRSPPRQQNSREASAAMAMNGKPMQPKLIEIDHSLPPDNIKVLSRTLFVGGANGSQQDIQAVFERFGEVQTCIANRDKRHAFVKMTTRESALAAKRGMEELSNRNDREVMLVARQTKWGVGFGPRECCDYQRGESIIPIHKLTDADMKWLLGAEYGGTGGRQVEGGMVLEEPDIEIGAGVSSKAMSRRVGPDHNNAAPTRRQFQQNEGGGGGRGGRRGRGGRDYDGNLAAAHNGGGGYNGQAMNYPRPEPVAVATPPAVPNFGFQLPGQTGTYR